MRAACSVILIITAAAVKASVEEVLPFHADHRSSAPEPCAAHRAGLTSTQKSSGKRILARARISTKVCVCVGVRNL